MNSTINLNTFAIATPILLATIGLIDNNFFFWAILSTMMTGIIQVVVGIKMLIDNPKNIKIKLYLAWVIIFFSIWYINVLIGYDNDLTFILFGIPPILAIYLSILIYKKNTKS